MKVSFILLILLLCISCTSQDATNAGGICLSFDDRNIENWYNNRKIFAEHHINVTYFITQPDSLTRNEVKMLRTMQQEGNEIGFHGNMHVISEHYIKSHGYSAYFKKEIDQGMKTMDSLGFVCQSFAYPYGAKYWFTDYLLNDRFKTLRGVAVKRDLELNQLDQIYYEFDESDVKFALDLSELSLSDSVELASAIHRANKDGTVIQFFGHEISESSVELLQWIIEEAFEHDMEFYTYAMLTSED